MERPAGAADHLDDQEKFTVPMGLANLVTLADTPWNLTMAANLVSILPTCSSTSSSRRS